MKLCRLEVGGTPRWGVIEEGMVSLLAAAPWIDAKRLGGAMPLEGVKLLPPCEASKIVCVGLNYRAHAAEQGAAVPTEPVLFLKAPSALLPPDGTVLLPEDSALVHYEGELALVIGRRTHRIAAPDALSAVLGYTCLDDVSARDIQRREKIYARAKGFDTFCPLGPWLETEIPDPQALEITLRVNGEVRQHGPTSDMIFPVADLIAFISRIMTLEPGDVITTGTPPGVGAIVAGDSVEIEISGVGVLRHGVADAPR
jgi:2-keto-4-pentenoate hydratase/2-oxohepta-3-ene-1,7-dioic acid hydratase in catechol pathway